MTTIVYTPGMFAADQCLTEETDDGVPVNRTYGRKLRYRNFYAKRPAAGTVLAVASRGDADAGEELDELLLSQGSSLLKSGCLGLCQPMNDTKLLKARTELIKDSGTDALLVWFSPQSSTCYRVNGRGRLSLITNGTYATGYDAGVAYGALGMGANAVQAVSLAAKHGVCTSFPIDYLEQVDGKVEFKTLKG